MRWSYAIALAALVPGGLAARAAGADCTGGAGVPCPETSTATAVLASPGGNMAYRVVVKDQYEDPVAGVTVSLDFSHVTVGGPTPTFVYCICCPMPYTELTNTGGVAVFHIAGGGFLDVSTSSEYVEVFAGAVSLGQVGIRSSDVYDPLTDQPHPDGTVGVIDAARFSEPFQTLTLDPIADFDGDGKIGFYDFILVRYDVQNSAFCTIAP